MRDAVVRDAVFAPHGRAVEKIGRIATAWPRDNTVDVEVVVGKVIAGVEVRHLITALPVLSIRNHFVQHGFDDAQ